MLSIDDISNDPIHDVDVFKKLVPTIDNDVLPVPVTAVQVTRFKSGGPAIGVASHHTTLDGKGLWTFMKAWACRCKGNIHKDVGVVNDRAILISRIGSKDVALKFVWQLAPGFPSIEVASIPVQDDISMRSRLQLTRRTLFIPAKKIEFLKQEIMKNRTYANLFKAPPSRFVVVTSLLWVCFSHVRPNISPDDISTLAIPLDCRPHLDPSVPENFIGNCVKSKDAKIKWSKLQSENGPVNACIQSMQSIKEGKNDVLKGCEEWAKEMFVPPSVNYWVIGLGTGIKPYDTDFGFGKPKRVEQVNLGGNIVACMFEKEGGVVQVSVELSSEIMDRFVKEFDKLSCWKVKSPPLLLSRL